MNPYRPHLLLAAALLLSDGAVERAYWRRPDTP